jgi:transposase
MLTKQQRELIVKLRDEGRKQEGIADLLGCSQAAVSKWISKSKKGRTLETLPRSGRPTVLKGEFREKLRHRLIHEVKQANEKYCSLDTKQLSSIITEEVQEHYSLRHVGRILHNMGFSLVKPRSQHLKHDAKKVAEFKENFKKNLNKSIWVISS